MREKIWKKAGRKEKRKLSFIFIWEVECRSSYYSAWQSHSSFWKGTKKRDNFARFLAERERERKRERERERGRGRKN